MTITARSTRLALRAMALGTAGVASIALVGVHAGAFEGMTDPMQLLSHSASAGHHLSYSGTQFIAIYGEPETATVIADVTHTAGEGSLLRVHATPRMPARDIYEADNSSDPWSTLGSGLGGAPFGSTALELLSSHYSAAVTGKATVAGRPTEVVELKRATGETAARFWLDVATALPLRREVYDEKGQLTRLSAFLDFTLRPPKSKKVPTSLAAHSSPAPTMTGELLTPDALAAARQSGWVLPDALGSLQLVEIRRAGSGDVLHLVYSDGLATVSVFQQPGRLSAPGGWTQRKIADHSVWVNGGVPTAVAWSAKGKVYTVVSDGAAAQLEAVVKGLPRGGRHHGLLHRLHRGVDRVGSWFNPFA